MMAARRQLIFARFLTGLITALFLLVHTVGFTMAASTTGHSSSTGETSGTAASPIEPARYVPPLEIDHSSSSAVVIDVNRKRLLYAKNTDDRLNIPAASKLMTAWLSCKKLTPETMITISKVAEASEKYYRSPDGVTIKSGDKYSMEYLLLRLLFYNSDAAAIALAEQISGVEEDFVKLMNAQAETLGLAGTLFANCTGQPAMQSGQDGTADSANGTAPQAAQYTTTLELAVLVASALQDQVFARMISLEGKIIVLDNDSLVSMSNVMKPIWTLSESKITGAFYSESNGRSCMVAIGALGSANLVIVTASGAPGKRMMDLQAISDACCLHYEVTPLVRAGARFTGEEEQTVDGERFGLIYKSTVNYIHPVGDFFLKESIRYKSLGPFRRPIQYGMTVGQVVFELVDGTTIPVDVAPDRQILSSISFLDKLLVDLQDNRNLTMVILVAGCLLMLVLLFHVIRGVHRFVNLISLVVLEKRSRR